MLKDLPICESMCIYLSFHNRPLLNVNDNVSMSGSHHGHCKHKRRQNTVASCFAADAPPWFDAREDCTSCGHAHIAVNTVRIAAKLLKAVDGALAHDGFPAKRPVVDYLQHDGRRVHLLFGEKLVDRYNNTARGTPQVQMTGDVVHKQINDGYHFEEQNRSGEVGVLFEVPDDGRLNDFTATFYNQTGGGHSGQLVGLHVPQAPCQDLGWRCCISRRLHLLSYPAHWTLRKYMPSK